MKLFDLHCDTIERMEEHGENMLTENCQLSLRYLPQVEKWCQTFAIFIPDSKRGADAMEYYERVRAYFHKMLDEHKDIVEFVHNADDIKPQISAEKPLKRWSVRTSSWTFPTSTTRAWRS